MVAHLRLACLAALLIAGLAGPAPASETGAAPATATAEDDAGKILAGKELVTSMCARCHAVGKTDTSPLEQAPPFRDLMQQYPPEDLEEAFAEGIVTGHPDMPEFVLEPEEINALLTYLDTLRH